MYVEWWLEMMMMMVVGCFVWVRFMCVIVVEGFKLIKSRQVRLSEWNWLFQHFFLTVILLFLSCEN